MTPPAAWFRQTVPGKVEYDAFSLGQQIKKGKTSSEMEAYPIALEAIRALHSGSARGEMAFISSTPGKIKKRESLGEPHYIAEEGCSVWVIKTP